MNQKMKPQQQQYSRGNVMERFRPYRSPFRVIAVLALTLMVLFAAIHAAQAYSVNQASTPAQQTDDSSAPQGANPDPSCRYGVATLGDSQVPFVGVIGAGWYIDFSITAVPASNGAEFAHVISVKQDKSGATYLPTYSVTPPLTSGGLGAQIASNPGALWIVGNEVDRGPNPGDTTSVQGDTHPAVYAEAYHAVYHYIKQQDPTALVSNSALVQITPGRMQYLDLMYDAYVSKFGTGMPVDVWNMHLYILPEVNPQGQPNGIASVAVGTDPALGISESYDPDGGGPAGPQDTCASGDVYCFAEHDSMTAFTEQVVRMRQWMHDHGYRHRPLLLSEYSLLLPYEDDGGTCFVQDEFGNCFTPSRVQAFMTNTFNYLSTATDPNLGFPADNNRLVQQWLWFSIHNLGVGQVSNLIQNETSGALTNLGVTFKSSVEAEPNYINLYPARVNSPFAFTDGSTTADVTLTARVGNNGPTTAGSFQVTFYSNSALTNVIGSASIPAKSSNFPGMTGCGTRNIAVSVPWNDLGPGMHHFWVKVDSGNAITESPPGQDGEANNVLRGTVFIDPLQMFLPAVSRR